MLGLAVLIPGLGVEAVVLIAAEACKSPREALEDAAPRIIRAPRRAPMPPAVAAAAAMVPAVRLQPMPWEREPTRAQCGPAQVQSVRYFGRPQLEKRFTVFHI